MEEDIASGEEPETEGKPVINLPVTDKVTGHGEERKLADGVKARISIKDKLAQMTAKIGRDKANGQKTQERSEGIKSKGKEESL